MCVGGPYITRSLTYRQKRPVQSPSENHVYYAQASIIISIILLDVVFVTELCALQSDKI